MKELKEIIKGAMDDYRYRKTQGLDLDNDTDLEIFGEVNYLSKRFCDDIDELDSTIDAIIENTNEESLYEYDMREDAKLRTRDLIGG